MSILYYFKFLFSGDEAYILKKDKNGKMGVVDFKGNVIVPFEYDHIEYRRKDCFRAENEDRIDLYEYSVYSKGIRKTLTFTRSKDIFFV